MIEPRKQGILYAHIAALLFAGTALFAKLIELPAPVTTFWRTAVAIAAIAVICKTRRQNMKLDRTRDIFIQIGLGFILGIHWATYYASIQLSTIAIGVTALFTAPILTVLIESILRKVWPDKIDLLLGGVVFIGVLCLSPSLQLESNFTKGILLGILSAFFLSLRQILHTRAQARNASGLVLLFYQLIGIGILFAFSGITADHHSVSSQWLYILILGIFFTAIPHFFNLRALKELEAKTVLIITSLMLPYGIITGIIFLGEIPTGTTLIGCLLVLFAATIENLRTVRL